MIFQSGANIQDNFHNRIRIMILLKMRKHMHHFLLPEIFSHFFMNCPDRQKQPAGGPSLPHKSTQHCDRSSSAIFSSAKTSVARSSGSTKRQRLSTYTRISPLVCCSASLMAATILFFSTAEKNSFFEKNGIFNTWVFDVVRISHPVLYQLRDQTGTVLLHGIQTYFRKYYSGNF